MSACYKCCQRAILFYVSLRHETDSKPTSPRGPLKLSVWCWYCDATTLILAKLTFHVWLCQINWNVVVLIRSVVGWMSGLVGVTWCDWGIRVEFEIVAEWIWPRTLAREVPGSNLPVARIVPWGARHFILIA